MITTVLSERERQDADAVEACVNQKIRIHFDEMRFDGEEVMQAFQTAPEVVEFVAHRLRERGYAIKVESNTFGTLLLLRVLHGRFTREGFSNYVAPAAALVG